MLNKKSVQIYISSDKKAVDNQLNELLNSYKNYDLHFIPTDYTIFDIMNMGPDVIVMNKKVIKCHDW